MSLIWLQLGEKMRHTDEEKRHYWWKIAFEYHSNLLSTLTAEDFPDTLTGQKDTAITRFL